MKRYKSFCVYLLNLCLFLVISAPLAIAAQKASEASGSSGASIGWFSSLYSFSSLSGSVVKKESETLGHGSGIGAKQITKLIFPGIYSPKSDINEGKVIGNFQLEHAQIASSLYDFTYKGFMMKPFSQDSAHRRPSGGHSKLMVWFHGNAELASQTVFYVAELFTRLGAQNRFQQDHWSVLVVEYPGFGGGDGFPQAYILEDMITQWHSWIQDSAYKNYKTCIFGRSIGTAMATYWAAKYDPAGLILDSPFPGISDIAASLVPIPGLSYLVRKAFGNILETKNFIDRVKSPTLVITRGRDSVIPETLGVAQYQAIQKANHQTTHISLRQSDHNHFYTPQEEKDYHQSIADFLSPP